MSKYKGFSKMWFLALLLVAVVAGCASNGGETVGTAGTAGTTRPAVKSTIPAATTPVQIVLPDTAVTVTFNKDMAPGSITASGAFTVTGPGSTPVQGAAIPVTYDVATQTATFHPLVALAPGTYTATVKGTGPSAVTDLALPGNALAGNPALPLVANDYVWNFTTSLTAPALRPTVTSSVPAKTTPIQIVLPGTLITAKFDKVMDAATITAPGAFTVAGVTGAVPAVTYDIASKTATFHPAAPLTGGVTYTATIKGTGPNPVKDSSGNALAGISVSSTVANDYVWSFAIAVVAPPGAGILDLMSYGIASAGGITNSGATKINGNVVLDPLDQCNNVLVGAADNFGLCGGAAPTNNAGDKVITQTHPDTTTADAIRAQLLVKWNSISPAGTAPAVPTVLGCGVIGSAGGGGAGKGCAGSSTLPAGIYIAAIDSIGVSGVLTLNGNATDVWIFQAPSSTVITAVNSSIVLTGGAKASNVWWFVGSSATLNDGTTFQGNILASASISMGTGATSCGRLLAGAEGAGAFTFLANTVSVPGHPNAPVGCQ
jgi:hypothetical protein